MSALNKAAIGPGGVEESMSKDHLERRTYRKSPGRQYGYDYDPLRSQSGQNQIKESQYGETASKSGALLSQRPNPRRTRQIMRQSIIASKRINDEETVDFLEQEQYPQRRSSQELYEASTHDGYIEYAENTTERSSSRAGKRYVTREVGPDEYMATAPGGRRSSLRAARVGEPALPHTRELLPSEDEYLDDPYHPTPQRIGNPWM